MPSHDFPLGHLVLRLSDGADGRWFGLMFPDAAKTSDRGPIASGPVGAELAAQLRAAADHLEGLE